MHNYTLGNVTPVWPIYFPSQRDEVKRLTDIFRARIIDVTDTTYTIELTGATEKILAFINSMGKIKIIEMVRSGALGIRRGVDSLEIIK